MKWPTVVTTLCSAEAQELPTDDRKEGEKKHKKPHLAPPVDRHDELQLKTLQRRKTRMFMRWVER